MNNSPFHRPSSDFAYGHSGPSTSLFSALPYDATVAPTNYYGPVDWNDSQPAPMSSFEPVSEDGFSAGPSYPIAPEYASSDFTGTHEVDRTPSKRPFRKRWHDYVKNLIARAKTADKDPDARQQFVLVYTIRLDTIGRANSAPCLYATAPCWEAFQQHNVDLNSFMRNIALGYHSPVQGMSEDTASQSLLLENERLKDENRRLRDEISRLHSVHNPKE